LTCCRSRVSEIIKGSRRVTALLRSGFSQQRGRVTLRVLLASPDGEASAKRAAEVGESPESFADGIRLSIVRLRELADAVDQILTALGLEHVISYTKRCANSGFSAAAKTSWSRWSRSPRSTRHSSRSRPWCPTVNRSSRLVA
jgi:hypothetical protein